MTEEPTCTLSVDTCRTWIEVNYSTRLSNTHPQYTLKVLDTQSGIQHAWFQLMLIIERGFPHSCYTVHVVSVITFEILPC